MDSECSRFALLARRARTIAVVLPIAASGTGLAACGDDGEDEAELAIEEAEKEIDEAQKDVESVGEDAGGEIEKGVDEAQDEIDEAQKEIEK